MAKYEITWDAYEIWGDEVDIRRRDLIGIPSSPRDSFADARLAAIYGIEGVSGTGLQPVTLPETRAGILGQAAWLAGTSHSDQTSPIRRGLFVRQVLLCQEFSLPPADAGGVPDVDPDATTRDRFDLKRPD